VTTSVTTLQTIITGSSLALAFACGTESPTSSERETVRTQTAPGWLASWGEPARLSSVSEGAGTWLEQSVCGHLAAFDFTGGFYEVTDIQTACVQDSDRELPVRTFVLLTETESGEELWLTSPGGWCGRYAASTQFSATLGGLVQVSRSELEWEEDLEAYTAWTNQLLHVGADGTYSLVGQDFALDEMIAVPSELADYPDTREACPVQLMARTGDPMPQHPDAPRLIDPAEEDN
jgi:hypothetical protein